jgi:outer membrane receptor protein involved in Fe transport
MKLGSFHMKKSRLFVTGSLLGLAVVAASPSYAQSDAEGAAPAAQEEGTDEAAAEGEGDKLIVVSGSRIARPNNTAAVPIITVDADDLVGQGDVSLGDKLNQLPALRSTFSLANSTGAIGTSGLNFLDLRGLGTTRTLVLVNGRRHVTAAPGTYRMDVNTIPTDLLERVDVVTGGSSAVYGSDAIAGVVNFVLKRDFEGIKLRGQGGISKYGDRGAYFLSGVAGQNFFDGRVNAAIAMEYSKNNTLFFSDRPYVADVPGFVTDQITTAPNRNFDGIPNTVFVDGGIRFGNISQGGYVLTACPVATATNTARVAAVCTGQLTPTGGRINSNYAFLPDGTLARDVPTEDRRPLGGGVIGGLSSTGVEDAMLQPGVERYAANLLLNGDFSSAFKPFLEAKYVRVNANQQSAQPTFIAGTLSPVFSVNNPFLTPQARATLTTILAPGATTFTMQRFNSDFGPRSELHKRETFRIVAGASGELDSGTNTRYEFALNYGRTENSHTTGGNVLLSRYRNAVNAVLSGGQIVCAINADADPLNNDTACVPLNVFGEGAPSRAALDYVVYDSKRVQTAEQINATAFLSGTTEGIFELPGGAVGWVLGAEYRKEKATSVWDDVTTSGATFLNAILPFRPPAAKVKEAFGELRLPILADLPFAHELTLEGSARISDYGGGSKAVWAYNMGAIWAPIPDLRLRVGYAKAVRAPTLADSFATRSENFNNVVDPCNQTGAGGIQDGPNRAANCAAAGIPTTITYADDGGVLITRPWTNTLGASLVGFNQGNPNLLPETGKSLTIGGVFQPSFLPGFTLSLDYYRINVNNVISGLTAQAIINRCYDDPGGINNPFCAAVFRRSTGDVLTNFTFAGQTVRRLESRTDVVIARAPGSS